MLRKRSSLSLNAAIELLESRRLLSDVYEPNNSLATATDFGTLGDREETGTLDIDPSGDQDFFKFTAASSGNVFIRISFISFFGDLDLHLYGPAGNIVATSDGSDNTEQINYTVLAGQTYTINVAGFQGATNTYDLLIDGPDAGGGSADRFEPNDDFAGATDLGTLGDRVENDLSIHQANNDDYFKFTAAASGSATVGVTFTNSSGDLDMAMYNGSQQLLQTSESSGDNESITQPVTAGQVYYVKVYGFNGATNPQYNLSIHSPGALTAINYDFATRQAVTFNFNGDVRPTFSRASFALQNLTTGQPVDAGVGDFGFNNSGDHAELVLTNLLPDANYSVTGAALPLSFFSLTGDANQDRNVNTLDFIGLAQNFNKTSGVSLTSGDVNYDGKVNALDFNAIASRYGTTLAPASAQLPVATAAAVAQQTSPRLFGEHRIAAAPLATDLLTE